MSEIQNFSLIVYIQTSCPELEDSVMNCLKRESRSNLDELRKGMKTS
jgi:hypothetical protein